MKIFIRFVYIRLHPNPGSGNDFDRIIQLAYEIIIQYFRDETDAELEPSQDGLQYRFNPGDNNENFEF